MKKTLILFLLFISFEINAQGEASNWYFGNGAGLIFDINTGTVSADDSAINTISTTEGCSSISDPNGNLLFYTDGRNVWDANHQIMPNGNYSAGLGLLGDPSSTSSAVIVPKPGNSNQYYIFTVDEPHHNNSWAYPNQGPADVNGNPLLQYDDNNGNGGTVPNVDDGFNNGFNYSLVDLTLNGGMGDVVTSEKNVHLVTYDPTNADQLSYRCAEKITAVEHADGQSYWVITQFIDTFYAFRIDNSGVNPTPVTTQILPIITTNGYRRNGIGYMKSSPDGSKIVACHNQNGTVEGSSQNNSGSFWLYDFDNVTGAIHNEIVLLSSTSVYGADFSADSKKLYVSNLNRIVQFDLEAANISVSQTIVHQQNNFLGAIQLGPDGKIYICNTATSNTLDVINAPGELGVACDYQTSGITLSPGTNATLGLPPFIQSFLIAVLDAENLCLGDATQFTIDSSETFDSIEWDFGDSNTSTDENPLHTYSLPGTYNVTATLTAGTEIRTFNTSVTIFDVPVANQPNDVNTCDDNNDGVFSFDLPNLVDAEILGTQDPNTFSISYFESLDDANNNINALPIPYTNTNNPVEIFARIENSNNSECFDVTSFIINVYNTPNANPISDLNTCDNNNDGDLSNGQVTTNLLDLNSTVLSNQDAMEYSITYHNTQADADNGTNSILTPNAYYNLTPNIEEVFVRIENNLFTDCFDTTSFNIIVNPIPESFNTSLFQCDEDGIPEGFTLFNLTEANDDLTGGNPNVTTQFYETFDDAQNSINAINESAYSNIANPQIIYVQVNDNNTDCFSIAELLLEVSATSANDALLSNCDDDGSEDGFYTFNLSDADSTVLNNLPATVILTYYETYEDALLETNPLNTTFTNTTPYNQVIYARVEDDNACYGINEVELVVFELPNIEITEDILYCLNDFPELVTLTGGFITDIPNNYYFDWSTGQNTTEIEVNEIGNYTVTVTNVNGCSKQRTISILPSNIATIESINVVDATSNNTVTVNVSGEGEYVYALDNINGPYQESNLFEYVNPGIHTVFVKDIKNDCGIVEDIVSVIGFPKFFTPNNDTYNETWHVYGINTPNQYSSLIYIFDRYGKLITQLDPKGPGWDGTHNGNPMPTSDYWFYVVLQDGRKFRSHFTLKR